jgi:hypothetical protein
MADRSDGKGRIEDMTFILDSGSSDHMVNDRSFFHSICKLDQPMFINIAKSGEAMVAKEQGEVRGYSNKGVHVTLKMFFSSRSCQVT